MAEKQSLWNPAILRQAAFDSFRKLDPRLMVKNPVMLVVEIGSVLTSVLLIQGLVSHQGSFAFNLQITLWLWFTVLFANFAEAMAEGPRQGPGRHAAQGQGRDDGRSPEEREQRLGSGRGFQCRSPIRRHYLRRGRALYPRATERSSKAWPRWTNRPSPENQHP